MVGPERKWQFLPLRSIGPTVKAGMKTEQTGIYTMRRDRACLTEDVPFSDEENPG